MWIDQHLRCRLGNSKIESFQSADALRKLHAENDVSQCDDSWIEDHLPIVGTLYYRDIFKCIQFLLAHLPFQAHLNYEPVPLGELESCRLFSKMNTGNWWWDIADQLTAKLTFVPVICASDKTHLTNCSGDQHAWQLYLMIGNDRKDIRCTPEQRA